MNKLEQAKQEIRSMLDMADNNADAVFRALERAAKVTRQGCTREQWEQESEAYALKRLALADLTGNAGYRL